MRRKGGNSLLTMDGSVAPIDSNPSLWQAGPQVSVRGWLKAMACAAHAFNSLENRTARHGRLARTTGSPSAPRPAGSAARSGRSGSSTATPPSPALNFSGAADPSRVTDFDAGHILQQKTAPRPARQDRVDDRCPCVVKKASMAALPGSGLRPAWTRRRRTRTRRCS